jgi:hypothetical protein
MSNEMTQDNVQENQETQVKNEQNQGSDSNSLHEIMAKKAKLKEKDVIIEEKDAVIAEYKAKEEKQRTKKLEEDGKYKELIAEQSSTIDNLNSKLESQSRIVNNYKQSLVDGLTSDSERKEYLSTKPVDFLEELTKEKNLMQPQTVSNPGESLGAVRKTVPNKSFSDMSEAEKREWHKQMTTN